MTDKKPIEEMPKEESFGLLDIFNYEKVFSLADIENDGDLMFWFWVVVFYVILFIPCWIIVRAILFFILPKSWLKKMFDI